MFLCFLVCINFYFFKNNISLKIISRYKAALVLLLDERLITGPVPDPRPRFRAVNLLLVKGSEILLGFILETWMLLWDVPTAFLNKSSRRQLSSETTIIYFQSEYFHFRSNRQILLNRYFLSLCILFQKMAQIKKNSRNVVHSHNRKI